MLPWDPGFYEILNSARPIGKQQKFIIRDPVSGLNVWCKDLDSLKKIADSDEYEEWEEQEQEKSGIEPHWKRPMWV